MTLADLMHPPTLRHRRRRRGRDDLDDLARRARSKKAGSSWSTTTRPRRRSCAASSSGRASRVRRPPPTDGSALDLIREQPPDVVVLDVHLPELDGLEVLREIVRSDERTGRPTGVLGVSGDPTADDRAVDALGRRRRLHPASVRRAPSSRCACAGSRTGRARCAARARVLALPRAASPRTLDAVATRETGDELGGLGGTRTTPRPPRSIRASKLIATSSSTGTSEVHRRNITARSAREARAVVRLTAR